jgi:hypothetical protein
MNQLNRFCICNIQLFVILELEMCLNMWRHPARMPWGDYPARATRPGRRNQGVQLAAPYGYFPIWAARGWRHPARMRTWRSSLFDEEEVIRIYRWIGKEVIRKYRRIGKRIFLIIWIRSFEFIFFSYKYLWSRTRTAARMWRHPARMPKGDYHARATRPGRRNQGVQLAAP